MEGASGPGRVEHRVQPLLVLLEPHLDEHDAVLREPVAPGLGIVGHLEAGHGLERHQPQLEVEVVERRDDRTAPRLDQRVEPLREAPQGEAALPPAVEVDGRHPLVAARELDEPPGVRQARLADRLDQLRLGELGHDLRDRLGQRQELDALARCEVREARGHRSGRQFPQHLARCLVVGTGQPEERSAVGRRQRGGLARRVGHENPPPTRVAVASGDREGSATARRSAMRLPLP